MCTWLSILKDFVLQYRLDIISIRQYNSTVARMDWTTLARCWAKQREAETASCLIKWAWIKAWAQGWSDRACCQASPRDIIPQALCGGRRGPAHERCPSSVHITSKSICAIHSLAWLSSISADDVIVVVLIDAGSGCVAQVDVELSTVLPQYLYSLSWTW